ncbi:DNA topoisomerase (ATP-hydrolyzing) subunit A, partial [Staphylococcus pseudintermedius]|nr:DNA topoisomerase (ATP-hydrolyzing) subunit A [Staphylococcus pseudintermedius]
KNTDLQVAYNFNMVAITEGRPKLMGIKPIISSYLNHQIEVVTRRTSFDLKHTEERMHIVEGLMKALSILDEVIALIRNSKNKRDAKENLVKTYDFTEAQAEAIVMLQLYRLTNTDIVALQEEYDALKQKIAALKHILENHDALLDVIKEELSEIKKQFKQPRLSVIEEKISEIKIDKEVIVPSETVMLSLTQEGYIKRTSLRSFNASGKEEIGLKERDGVLKIIETNTQDYAMVFTNKGRYLLIPVHKLPDVKWKDLGQHVSQIVPIEEDERVVDCYTVSEFNDERAIITATRQGMIKKSLLSGFKSTRTTKPLVAMKVKESDALISVMLVPADASSQLITLLTHRGMSLTYPMSELPDTGLRATGIKAINLKDEDHVVLADHIQTEDTILIATQRGALKRISFKVLQQAKRAQRGITLLKELKKQPHRVVAARVCRPEQSQYRLVSQQDETTGLIKDIHLSEQYTNGSFVVDTSTFGEIEDLYVD